MIRDIERIYGTLLTRQYQKKLFQDLEGLQEKGDSLIARCPFHEDEHPTFIIYQDRPEYFCFVCGARGDWLGYLQLKTGMDFFGALRLLAGRLGSIRSPMTRMHGTTSLAGPSCRAHGWLLHHQPLFACR